VSTPPRVLIADDHPATRTGVRMALERDGIEVCAEAASASAAVDAALRERPDACLLDVRMPGGGISAASKISFELPATVVLMLTVSRDDDDLFESLRRGATGYLLKDGDPAKLAAAVRSALAGQAPLSGDLTAHLVNEFRQRPRPRRLVRHPEGRPDLTAREWEVLELLAEGVSTADLAKRLFLSQVTVRRHVSNILGKLGVSSREEAVRLALGDAESPEADGDEGPAPRADVSGPAAPTAHAVPALTYEHPAGSPPLSNLEPADADAASDGGQEGPSSAELERELAESRGALEDARRENEELRKTLQSERDRHRKTAAERADRPLEAQRPPADLDELVKTSLTHAEHAVVGDALERLPRMLEGGETVTHLGIGEYEGGVVLLAVTDRGLLVLKPNETAGESLPFAEVFAVDRAGGRLRRGSLRIATRRGEIVLKGGRTDALERAQLQIRKRISSSPAGVGNWLPETPGTDIPTAGSPSSPRSPSSI